MEDIKLRDFLNEGTVIKTKLSESNSWVTNVVYAINEDCIEIDIGLEKDYINDIIMVGDTIKCKYSTKELEYSLLGWVTRIKADYPQSITIRVHQLEHFDNKRNASRFDVYLSSVIKTNPGDLKGIFAIMINISKTGAAFMVREEIEKLLEIETGQKDHTIFIDVYISPEELFTLQGTIVRKTHKPRGIEYGLQILDMDMESEKILDVFLNELANKDKEFYNKRSGFWSKNSQLNKE